MGSRWAQVSLGVLIVTAAAGAVLLLRDPVDRVVLLGDSIAEEASPYLHRAVHDVAVEDRVFGGTAPCDWSLEEVGARRGDLVVISFTGNSLTPCMSDGAGGQLHGQALVDRYTSDVRALVRGIRGAGAAVLLVGQPQRGGDAATPEAAAEVSGINDAYQRLAIEDGVSFVDAGAAVEADDGSFASDLPCVPGEPECGPSGRNVVRNRDGVHLCPEVGEAGCAVYASGAFRFANAIADAVEAR